MVGAIGSATGKGTLGVAAQDLLILFGNDTLGSKLLGFIILRGGFTTLLVTELLLLLAGIFLDAIGIGGTLGSADALLLCLFGSSLGGTLSTGGILFILNLAVVLAEEVVLNDTEYALGNPVDRDTQGHNEAEPYGHQRHQHIHHLAGLGSLGCCCILFADGIGNDGIIHLLADEHCQIVQRAGDQRHNCAADLAPANQRPNFPAGLQAQVDAQEIEVQRLHACADDLTVRLDVGGDLELPVGIFAVDSLKGFFHLGDHVGIQVQQIH